MKVRARKLLSLLLTLAMVAGMFVLPASAAADMELDMATSAASALTDLSGDFTWSAGTGTGDSVATDKGYTFSDSYIGSKSVKWNGTSNASGSRRTLDFTTTAQATVKVWWYMAKAGAKLCIWTGSSTTATSGTDAAESNPSYAITTFENRFLRLKFPMALVIPTPPRTPLPRAPRPTVVLPWPWAARRSLRPPRAPPSP